MNIDIEKRRKRIETIVKILGLGITGFVVAPFVFIAIKGLIGLIIAAVIGSVAIYMTPAVAATLANWRLKAVKLQAAKNPVETLQNDYQNRLQALGRFRESISVFATEIKNFSDRLSSFVRQHPQEADKFEAQLDKMKQLLDLRKNKYEQAKSNLYAYELEIQKAGAIWEMSQAAAQMSKAAGLSEEDFLAKIQVETALDSVQKNLNLAFSDLELCLEDANDNKSSPRLLEESTVSKFSKQGTQEPIEVEVIAG